MFDGGRVCARAWPSRVYVCVSVCLLHEQIKAKTFNEHVVDYYEECNNKRSHACACPPPCESAATCMHENEIIICCDDINRTAFCRCLSYYASALILVSSFMCFLWILIFAQLFVWFLNVMFHYVCCQRGENSYEYRVNHHRKVNTDNTVWNIWLPYLPSTAFTHWKANFFI